MRRSVFRTHFAAPNQLPISRFRASLMEDNAEVSFASSLPVGSAFAAGSFLSQFPGLLLLGAIVITKSNETPCLFRGALREVSSCPGRRRPLPGSAFHALLLPRGTSETRAPSLHHLPASSLSCSACCTAEPLTLLVLMMAGVQKVLQGLLLPYTCDCKQPKQRISSTRAEAAAINKGSLKGRRETNKQKI